MRISKYFHPDWQPEDSTKRRGYTYQTQARAEVLIVRTREAIFTESAKKIGLRSVAFHGNDLRRIFAMVGLQDEITQHNLGDSMDSVAYAIHLVSGGRFSGMIDRNELTVVYMGEDEKTRYSWDQLSIMARDQKPDGYPNSPKRRAKKTVGDVFE